MAIKQIMLHKLAIGMTIAEDLYDDSQLICRKGTSVDEVLLKILRATSVISVPIYKEDDETKTLVNLPKNQTTHSEHIRNSESFKKFESSFHKETDSLSKSLNHIASGNEDVDIEGLFNSVNRIIEREDNSYQLMDMLSNIRYFDDSTYAHSLNVALLANILGQWLHFSDQDLKALTIAGMVHDIGKVLIPPEIIKKPGKLTEEEYNIIKQHTVKGYQLLKNKNVEDNIALSALLHHEKCDGSGYPLGLKKERIQDFAKIITIVDIYEAMTANRCYREGICPFTVIRMYEEEGYAKYDINFLLTFLKGIADTYLHNTVLLNDGRQGEIVLTNATTASKPGILIGNDYVDLARQPELNIVAIL